MARQSRIDYPGALHHIMVRGIEGRDIFATIKDRQTFLKRFGTTIAETRTPCYAYALMGTHVHLLIQTGETPISKLMQSILTGYACNYNYRYQRSGKLYQNRFKSILCDRDEYFLQLIRYIHLNPLKAGIIDGLSQLDKSPRTSHSIIMGNKKAGWIQSDEVLKQFGRTPKKARAAYRRYINAGIGQDEDLEGGGFVRSMGGEWEAARTAAQGHRETADERILGSGEFVESVLEHAAEQESRTSRLQRTGWDFESVLAKAAEAAGVEKEELFQAARGNARSRARALLCKWLIDDLKYTQTSIGEKLKISQSTVSKLVKRGRTVEKEMNVELE